MSHKNPFMFTRDVVADRAAANSRQNPPGARPEGSQSRHADWHFMNTPCSPDATPMPPGAARPNVLTKLKDFESFGTMPDEMQVYVLPWHGRNTLLHRQPPLLGKPLIRPVWISRVQHC
jgi:hypothetical protein